MVVINSFFSDQLEITTFEISLATTETEPENRQLTILSPYNLIFIHFTGPVRHSVEDISQKVKACSTKCLPIT